MITKITGQLLNLANDSATLAVEPFEYEILIPEFTRRHLQMKIGEQISLHTIEYIDGNVQKGGRMTPRLIGFNSLIEREFFELFCSVDGVGVKKALRAMVRPVQDVALAIEKQDIKIMSTLPGIGPATAERIVAKLRRKMAKFALMIPSMDGEATTAVEQNIIEDAYQILVGLGYSELEARRMLEEPTNAKKKYKDLDALLQAVLEQVGQT